MAEFQLSAAGVSCEIDHVSSASEIQDLAMKLPQRSRLKLAGELLRSVEPSIRPDEVLLEAARRDADIEAGKVKPLGEVDFWSGIKRRGKTP
jgi:hypothetical protein